MRTLAWMARNTKFVGRTPSTETPRRRRLVVTERGVAGVEGALEDGAFEETILVADAPGSAPIDLALRVAARVALLERQSKTFSSATLMLAGGREAQAVATHELVARTLLTHLKAVGGGELIILASGSGERDALLGLVEKLLREVEMRSVTIRLQFRGTKTPLPSSAPTSRTWVAA